MSDAVDFLYADKHGSLLQIDTKIIWWVWWSSIPKVSLETLQVCNVFTISLNKLEMKLSFFLVANVEGFFKIDTVILGVSGQACANYVK